MNARVRLLLSVLALGACGEPPSTNLEEWTPADHQQEDVADDVRGAAPDGVEADPATTEIRAAASLFGAMCASCHGPGGRGDGPGRPPIAEIPNFTDAAFQASRTDEQLTVAVSEGRGGFMPGFGDRLSPEGIAALVRHVRRLGPVAEAPQAVP